MGRDQWSKIGLSRLCQCLLHLNSSPIDELGDGACQSGRWFWGKQRALSHKPWAGHTGIHGNSASGNHLPGRVTLTKSVEILANPILTKSTSEGGKGRGEKRNNWMKCCLKRTASHTAETNKTCDSRNPLCHLNAHDSLTTADQHWLDFNLVCITFSHMKNGIENIYL